MRRVLSIILTILIMGTSVLSCSSGEDSKNTASTEQQTSSADTVQSDETSQSDDILENRKNVQDSLPNNLDFNGATLQMIVQTEHYNDATVEELTGELVDDEVYMRNSRVSERLNIVINPAIQTDYGSISSMVGASVMAGDGAYDLVLQHAVTAGGNALQDYFINWYEVPYVDFTKPWYPQESIKDLTIKDQMYITVSDMCLSLTKNTYCMFFDKVVAEQYNLENMYDIVNRGEWTLDKLRETTKDIYVDVDGNGKSDKNDFFGFATDLFSNINTYLWSCDQPIVEFTEDDQVIVHYTEEKTANIIEKITDLIFNQVGGIGGNEHRYGLTLFEEGHALFCNSLIGYSAIYLGDYENEFGIIPYPKYDEAQENYYTMVDGNFSVIAVPRSVDTSKLEMIGAATEALSADSWKNVIPKYYDITLKVRNVRDQESVAMLDMIMEGRVVDFAYLYDNWEGFVFETQNIVANQQDFASYVAKRVKLKTKIYEKRLEFFSERQP